MIRSCTQADFSAILAIIIDAAGKYKGVIPSECWHEPYMTAEQLKKEMDSGVVFYGYEENGKLVGVMGLQEFPEVTLIRHAYVLTALQGKGIGGKLLKHLLAMTKKPVLIGTWRDTDWSIKFYEKHGFRVLQKRDINEQLRQYWNITDAHRDNSVVLADEKWFKQHSDANYFC